MQVETTQDEYISQDDEAEAKRVKDTSGYGEILTTDDVRAYSLSDLGMMSDDLSR
ncbi:MAG: hypothetical protein HMLIMOIP_002091 [Candidatus Nitrosomirales archaeon]|jgi:hypothetical protein